MNQDVDWLINLRARAPLGGCQDVRVCEPYAFADRRPDLRCLFQDAPRFTLPHAEGERRRLLVWQRPQGIARNLATVRAALKRGYLIVVDYDDFPNRAEDIDCDFFPLRACHAVQTSTPNLAEVLRRFNPNVAVFENKISPPAAKTPARENQNPRVLFAALNRTEELLALAPTVATVMKAHPVVDLVIVGDRAAYNAIDCATKTFRPLLGYGDYWDCLDTSDIILLPLGDTLFNRCKSPLKFLEAAARGVAALASPTVYSDLIQHGRNGLLFANSETFAHGLERLLDEPDLRRRLAGVARAEIMENWLLTDADFERRLTWYEALDRDREALTRALLARSPELA